MWQLAYINTLALTGAFVRRSLDVASHQSGAYPEEEPYDVCNFNEEDEDRGMVPRSTAMVTYG